MKLPPFATECLVAISTCVLAFVGWNMDVAQWSGFDVPISQWVNFALWCFLAGLLAVAALVRAVWRGRQVIPWLQFVGMAGVILVIVGGQSRIAVWNIQHGMRADFAKHHSDFERVISMLQKRDWSGAAHYASNHNTNYMMKLRNGQIEQVVFVRHIYGWRYKERDGILFDTLNTSAQLTSTNNATVWLEQNRSPALRYSHRQHNTIPLREWRPQWIAPIEGHFFSFHWMHE